MPRQLQLIGVALLGALTLALVVYTLHDFNADVADTRPSTASASPTGAASSTPAGEPSGSAAPATTAVLVVGDSSCSDADSWPSLVGDRLEWALTTDCVDATGYRALGAGGDAKFALRADESAGADLVVLAGGRDDRADYPQEKVVEAAANMLKAVRKRAPDATVVMVSPIAGKEDRAAVYELSDALAQEAAAQGVTYVDVARVLVDGDGLLAPDGVHPSAEGQAALADAIAPALPSAG